MGGVATLLDDLHTGASSSLTGPEICERLTAIAAERSALAAEELELVAAMEARQEHVAEGFATVASWLVFNASQSHAEARATVRDARTFADRPVLAAATHEIGARRARVIAAAVPKVPAAHADALIDTLVDAARFVTVDDLQRLVQQAIKLADADGTEPADDTGTLTAAATGDGTLHLRGALHGEAGAFVKAAIDAEADRIWRAERSCDDGVRTTPAQRRAEALTELVRRGHARATAAEAGADPLPFGNGPAPRPAPTRASDPVAKPLVMVLVLLDVLERRAGRPAEIDGYGRISPDEAHRLCCDAHIHRVITDATSRPLDLGTTRPDPSPHQRRAIRIRDGGCAVPGCGRPPDWCDIHHTDPRHLDGPTDYDQLVMLCRRHHRYVHRGVIHVAPDGTGRFTFTRADGTPMARHPRTP